MNLTNDGLTLWFGTPDAPGPYDGEVVPRAGASLIVGVHPAHPTNRIVVSYRVDQGIVQMVPGREVRTDHARGIQYFVVSFPRFVSGESVEYWPVLGCGGRQVPAPQYAARCRGRFRLEASRLRATH